MREVSIETFFDDGCWWCKLIERGRPVPEGHLPNLAQCLTWCSSTEQGAIDKCNAFLALASGAEVSRGG